MSEDYKDLTSALIAGNINVGEHGLALPGKPYGPRGYIDPETGAWRPNRLAGGRARTSRRPHRRRELPARRPDPQPGIPVDIETSGLGRLRNVQLFIPHHYEELHSPNAFVDPPDLPLHLCQVDIQTHFTDDEMRALTAFLRERTTEVGDVLWGHCRPHPPAPYVKFTCRPGRRDSDAPFDPFEGSYLRAYNIRELRNLARILGLPSDDEDRHPMEDVVGGD
jgi:hypothetical protein